MNRDARVKLAQETIKIIEDGYYIVNNQQVDIKADLTNSLTNTILYKPGEFEPLLNSLTLDSAAPVPEISVTNESTLQAAKRSLDKNSRICCLNFASAKNPGGGFLSGSQAQEENLARSSGLYYSISNKMEMYHFNRKLDSCLYSDHLIYSPNVPVFRDDQGTLLTEPYIVSFITSPAVNAGAVRRNESHNIDKINDVMKHRARTIFIVAAAHKCDVLILGAWGCGVFENIAYDVANIFMNIIKTEVDLVRSFKKIIFAIYGGSTRKDNYRAFVDVINKPIA